MATYVKSPGTAEPLVKLAVYMYPMERQRVREQASRRGMAMSEYIKFLIERDHRGTLEADQ